MMKLKNFLLVALAVLPLAVSAVVVPARAPVVVRPAPVFRPAVTPIKPSTPVTMRMTKTTPPVIGPSPFFNWTHFNGKKKKECSE